VPKLQLGYAPPRSSASLHQNRPDTVPGRSLKLAPTRARTPQSGGLRTIRLSPKRATSFEFVPLPSCQFLHASVHHPGSLLSGKVSNPREPKRQHPPPLRLRAFACPSSLPFSSRPQRDPEPDESVAGTHQHLVPRGSRLSPTIICTNNSSLRPPVFPPDYQTTGPLQMRAIFILNRLQSCQLSRVDRSPL
jgi:hypothetical protein